MTLNGVMAVTLYYFAEFVLYTAHPPSENPGYAHMLIAIQPVDVNVNVQFVVFSVAVYGLRPFSATFGVIHVLVGHRNLTCGHL